MRGYDLGIFAEPSFACLLFAVLFGLAILRHDVLGEQSDDFRAAWAHRGYSIKKAEHTPYQRVGMERVWRGPLQSPRGVDKTCGPWPEPGQVGRHKHGTGLETDLS